MEQMFVGHVSFAFRHLEVFHAQIIINLPSASVTVHRAKTKSALTLNVPSSAGINKVVFLANL
jgi:hypothetical protein